MNRIALAIIAGLAVIAGMGAAPVQAQQSLSPTTVAPILISTRASAYFNQNLCFGMRANADVSALQEFLIDQGVYSGPVSGNFFLLTAAGVKQFQAKHSIRTTGYFGPKSRGVANEILRDLIADICPDSEDCDPIAIPSSLSITTDSALRARVGEYVVATFTVSGGSGSYAISNKSPEISGMNWTQTYCPEGNFCAQVVSPNTITLYGKPQKPGVYSILLLAKDSANATPGSIRYGEAKFSFLVRGESNAAPVISQVSGPQRLKAGEEGVWSVSAKDPSGDGQLSYSVTWDDEEYLNNIAGAPTAARGVHRFVQTATFAHTYRKPGTYKPVFTVANSRGQETKTSVTVAVSDQQTGALSIATESNLAGAVGAHFLATFTAKGGNAPYRWSIAGGQIPSGLSLQTPAFNCITTPCIPPPDHSRSVYLSGIPTQSGTFTFALQAKDGYGNTGVARFTILIDGGFASPAAGTTWYTGETYAIRWNASAVANKTVSLQLVADYPCTSVPPTPCPAIAIAPYIIAENIENTGVYEWKVPAVMASRYLGTVRLELAGSTGSISSTNFTLAAGKNRGLTVTSPVGGEVWSSGNSYAITWVNTSGSSVARNVTITLHPPRPACLDAVPYRCLIAEVAPYVIAQDIDDTGRYVWTVPYGLASVYQGTRHITVTTVDGSLSGTSPAFIVSAAAAY